MPDKYFDTPSGYNKHGQIAVLQDGRVIAYGKNVKSGDLFTGAVGDTVKCETIYVRVPDLRMIEYVLNVQFDISPTECINITHLGKKITGNVVGMTLASHKAVTGVTLTAEVIAIGPP
ncbi:unnamed protein product [marine sediment metagenome]|uniref:Uncharacterized protein n=1 Tax=marine sediment metagenome TaxID=412755 RepID=X1U7Y3_9ZZZZ